MAWKINEAYNVRITGRLFCALKWNHSCILGINGTFKDTIRQTCTTELKSKLGSVKDCSFILHLSPLHFFLKNDLNLQDAHL